MMGPAAPAALLLTHELSPLGLDDWAAACAMALGRGERLLTLFGRPEADGAVITTAVFLPTDGGLQLLRGRGQRNQHFASLTPAYPAAQMAERELWEQTGLVPEGHPWLKPVRYEGERQQQMGQHPFFTVRGQQVHEVGVGPIHASVIEPGHFRFMCHGEQVQHLEIQLGYQHRGIEPLLLRKPPLALSTQLETVAGDTSIAYAWGYCAAVEALCSVALPPQAELLRGIALELERIAMHLVALTGLATDIAFLQGGATYGRLRTAIINATMRICGSRFGRGWLRPGGVRFGIDDALRHDLQQTLAAFTRDITQINDHLLGARSVQSRFQGVGVLAHQAALDIGLVGLAARASGVALDLRTRLPGALYTRMPVAMRVEDGGDCWARLRLRMREIDESLRWLDAALHAPDLAAPPLAPLAPLASLAPPTPPAPPGPLQPHTLCVTLQEGFRGPVLQALETGAQGQLLHYKLQDPSLLNWFGLALVMRDNEISDFPICNKSFDLSYCGNDL